MKIMSRSFNRAEKALLIVLAIILLGLMYYWFVDQPVRDAITSAKAESDGLWVELNTLQADAARLEKMQAELDEIESSGSVSRMGSYNNSEAELRLLNDALAGTLQYSITFSDVTRSGNQIRRNFTLQFKTADYDGAREIVESIENSEFRCIIGDIRCTVDSDEAVTINAAATFYETMVGGTPDAGLPADSDTDGMN